ncbi:hypothetical protein QBC46DRAFT_265334 [Diplogelasinospora grovesii]|uniref:Uncharacterized protein n=1 Tax=Diplogelasinospora grovesii TaxID=303347 RepID=A0AAN6N3D7_9PEZI|nr:hypothetical protein QBC46DRAFT_265334 [Diplogelasinospora grovesii]
MDPTRICDGTYSSDACPQNITCPLDIPTNISIFEIPHQNSSHPAMVACCAPNPVHIAKVCWEWCEAPAAYLGNDSAPATQDFDSCMRAHNVSTLIAFGTPGSGSNRNNGSGGLTMMGLAIMALVGSALPLLV